MTNPTYLSGWAPEMCIQLEVPNNNRADFNRFLVKGFPSTKSMQQRNQFIGKRLGNYTYFLKFQGNRLSISGAGWHSSLRQAMM
jgi:hypothetical protein